MTNYCPSQSVPQDDEFLGCYRCFAGEEYVEESIHPSDRGNPQAQETLWCRNCHGRVNDDYELFTSGNAPWQAIPDLSGVWGADSKLTNEDLKP